MKLRELYEQAVHTPSDINELAPVLFMYAGAVSHVTEFGTRSGQSTAALLFARPRRLVTYDLVRYPHVNALEEAARAEGIDFRFVQADVRTSAIEPTDLLFIDTLHVYEQMAAELRHAPLVKRYILLHDTATYGIDGEGGGGRSGICPAVSEFLRTQPEWEIHAIHTNNNGLTVLRRRG